MDKTCLKMIERYIINVTREIQTEPLPQWTLRRLEDRIGQYSSEEEENENQIEEENAGSEEVRLSSSHQKFVRFKQEEEPSASAKKSFIR